MYILHIFIYMYAKAFLLHLIKAEKEHQKKRDEEIEEHKLNEMSTEYEIEKVKQTR